MVSPEGEDSPMVVSHHTQPRHGQGLGAVSLSQDQRAHVAVARARVVGVRQLGHTWVWVVGLGRWV